ncbi:MAG: type II toxin-antitoxin system PemK/MazF family toxin [Acidimicrobiia bacterium]|nr:type II toxin-antitoxin system PemK/MazF family toxin [Acidimicrobiia bacterium]
MASVDDLWLVDFGDPYPGEPAARRPALVIGPPDSFGPAFPFVILTPLTTTRRGLSLHIEVEATADTGLDESSYIQCELIRSINRKRLIHRLGAVDASVGSQVAAVVKTLLNY